MIYNLKKYIDKERAKKRFNDLLEEEAKIELKKKVKRTLRQNRYLHLILGWFGIELGYTLNEAKILFKSRSLDIFEYTKNEITFFRSSAELDSKKMTTAIERFRNWSSADAGVYLPEANEDKFLEQIEYEMSKNNYI